jgi:hypothetical protein
MTWTLKAMPRRGLLYTGVLVFLELLEFLFCFGSSKTRYVASICGFRQCSLLSSVVVAEAPLDLVLKYIVS